MGVSLRSEDNCTMKRSYLALFNIGLGSDTMSPLKNNWESDRPSSQLSLEDNCLAI